MKLLHGAMLGALLLAAPAVAMAGNGSGGGGLAGVVQAPVTAAFPGPSANQSSLTFAKARGTVSTDASAGTQAATGAYQFQPINNPVSIANQRGGGN